VFSIQGRLYTLNFLANLLLLKRLGHHESTTALATTDRTPPHRATLDRVPGSVSLNTRISRDGTSTSPFFFHFCAELAVQVRVSPYLSSCQYITLQVKEITTLVHPILIMQKHYSIRRRYRIQSLTRFLSIFSLVRKINCRFAVWSVESRK